MDEVTRYNKERWEALAQANVAYSRPFLGLDARAARRWLREQGPLPPGGLEDLPGKEVLCLAGSGGQQSAVLGLLGANVTVFDLSETQLRRDEETAAHYGSYSVRTVQGDMRDLSCFEDDSFDLVWQPYSLNFVPEPRSVFDEVARILRTGGLYRLEFANPFLVGLDERDWDGNGYPLKLPYVDGAELLFDDPNWDIDAEDGTHQQVIGPREFRHTFSAVTNTLFTLGFILLASWESPTDGDPNAKPGTWQHFIAIAPPWLGFWAAYRPELYSTVS